MARLSNTKNAIRKRYYRAIDRLIKAGKSAKGARRHLARRSGDAGVRALAQAISRRHSRVCS